MSGLPATGREERGRARSTTGSRRTRPRRRSPERKEGSAASVVKGLVGPLYGGVERLLYGGVERLLYGGAPPEARVECEAGASPSPRRVASVWGAQPAAGPGPCGPPPAAGPRQAAAASPRFSAEAPGGRAGDPGLSRRRGLRGPAGRSMPGVKLTTQAYCKMVLHGAKYPHCAVNGLLVAEKQKPRKEHLPLGGPGAPHTLFVDCIPLFHGTLALAPMLEVALTLIDSWCKDNSYVIAGYYQANERVKDARWTTPSSRWTAWYPRSTCTSTMKTSGGAETHTMITVKTGQRPRGSPRRSWTAGRTKHLWISITT
uniref:ER membrane protein complex subunit 8 n=1 Tax=Felis catus TaxID=9685 RepID=A0ABI7WGQ4_FELCA